LARELNFTKNNVSGMSVPDQRKVLVIDDEKDICFLFGKILRKRNLNAGYANNLAEAVRAIQAESPSLIFLDNSLPDGQGMDFIPYIKQHYPFTQVIVITANDSILDMKRAFKQGADEFLGKPLSLERINDTLDKMGDWERPV
jgi:DNA-binding NtrC family response regulator